MTRHCNNKGRIIFLSGLFALCSSLLFALCLILPDRASSGPYLSSAHGNSTSGVMRSHLDAKYSTITRGLCAHCHEQHASLGGGEPAPVDGGPDSYMVFTEWSDNYYNAFCNKCHDGTAPAPGADNIASSYNKTYKHPTTGVHSPTEEGSTLGTNRHGYCIDCHNPHRAQKPAHTAPGNTVASTSPIRDTWGVEPTFSSPPTPSPDTESLSTPTYTKVSPITKEYQLCLKCHSSYAYGSNPPYQITNPTVRETDQGKEFNTYNYCFHPVTGLTGQTWKNSNIRANYTTILKSPWNANLDARMYCSDCHGDDATGAPKGPHGSNKKYILKAWGGRSAAGSFPNAAYAPDLLCLLCHVDGYGNGAGVTTPWGHGSNPAHRYEGETLDHNRLGCYACHGGPAGYADFAGWKTASGITSNATKNGGRPGAIHGENFFWANPPPPSGWGYPNGNNPAGHFLVGGYNVGVFLWDYYGGSAKDGDGTCWSYGTGTSGAPCATMQGGKDW